ncbi:MAG: response regulator [Desulfobacterium sp.]|nr:response regulator [Desulfobacterium sp.]
MDILRKQKLRLFLLLILMLVVLAGCRAPDRTFKATGGYMDLTTWDIDRDGPVNLTGEWEFYSQSLLAPEDFTRNSILKKTRFIHLPGLWTTDAPEDLPQPSQGVATYRLRVRVTPDPGLKALLIQDILSVGNIWINGTPAASGGEVGTSRETEKPRKHTLIPRFYLSGEMLEIVIQVSNHHNLQGGINTPVWLGSDHRIQAMATQKWLSSAVMGGVLLTIGFYHLALYWLRKKKPVNIFFGLYAVLWAIQTLFGISGGCAMATLFPSLPWRLSIDLALMPIGLTTPLMVMFYHALFPNRLSPWVNRIFQAAGGGFLLYIMVTPPNAYDPVNLVFLLVSTLAFLYLFYRVTLDLIKKREGVYLLVPGYTILALFAINDILYDLHLIHTTALITWGLFIFILSHSFLIFTRFSRAFNAVEKLTWELQHKNMELSRLNLLKDEFLANTSHELKTPLHGIIGMAESLLGNPVPGKTANGLSIIISSGRRLSALINDLLDFSRLKSRDIDLKTGPVDIRALVTTVITVITSLIQGRPLVIQNNIPRNFPYLLGDENRLEQILFNLIGNAVKFTAGGEVRISATREENMARITVTDTGIGIPKDRLESIFESFEQVDQGASRAYGGTGIGLTITRDLVELHRGKINVVSHPGRGSVFGFTIPRADHPPDHDTKTGRAQLLSPITVNYPTPGSPLGKGPHLEKKDPTPHGTTVLAIDDDPVNLEVVVNHLEAQNMAVSTCLSGPEALAQINEKDLPDLILLDIMMPSMTGYEVCRILRQKYTASELPIIILTAKSRLSDLMEAFDTGVNDYLTKPFTRGELVARVKTQLKLKRAYQTFKENARLKNALALGEKNEQELKLMHQRLSGMLNTLDDAILAVNACRDIVFINRAFETLTRHGAKDLLGKPCATLFPHDREAQSFLENLNNDTLEPENPSRYKGLALKLAGEGQIRTDIMLTQLVLEEEHLHLLILEKSLPKATATAEPVSAMALVKELNHDSQRLLSLEGAHAKLKNLPPEKKKAVDMLLAHLEDDQGSEQQEAQQRDLAVTAMNLALDLWTTATQTAKVELADRSGLWNVYIGKDGWARTQTLDRYLNHETLPARPRWKLVINTADFVLAACDAPSPLRKMLETALADLRRTL